MLDDPLIPRYAGARGRSDLRRATRASGTASGLERRSSCRLVPVRARRRLRPRGHQLGFMVSRSQEGSEALLCTRQGWMRKKARWHRSTRGRSIRLRGLTDWLHPSIHPSIPRKLERPTVPHSASRTPSARMPATETKVHPGCIARPAATRSCSRPSRRRNAGVTRVWLHTSE